MLPFNEIIVDDTAVFFPTCSAKTHSMKSTVMRGAQRSSSVVSAAASSWRERVRVVDDLFLLLRDTTSPAKTEVMSSEAPQEAGRCRTALVLRLRGRGGDAGDFGCAICAA